VAAILGLRALFAAVGALSVGVGAGFEKAYDDAWDVSHLPTAPPPALTFTSATREETHHAARIRYVRIALAPTHARVTQTPRIPVLATAHAHVATASRTEPLGAPRMRVTTMPHPRATEHAIAAETYDEPVYEVPPTPPAPSTPMPNTATIRVPSVTPSPSPTPSPAKKEPSWLQKQLGHFDPFKPYKAAPSPTASATP